MYTFYELNWSEFCIQHNSDLVFNFLPFAISKFDSLLLLSILINTYLQFDIIPMKSD